MKSTITLLAFTTIVSSCLYSQSWQEEMDSVLTKLEKQEIFDGQVLIAEKGQILFNQAYGHKEDDGVKKEIVRTTSLGVESVSKIITSAAIMILHDQKRLNITDPLSKYFPRLPYPKVTIKDLLSMTSGLPRFLSTVIQYADTTQIITNNGIIELIERHKPEGEQAGERFQYNDANYILLASIVEQVSGQSFDEFLRENIFEPLKMENTSVMLQDLPDSLVNVDNFYQAYGAGNIHSTASDLHLFVEGSINNNLLSKESLALTYTPTTWKENRETAYGLGWHLRFDQDNKEVYVIGDGRNTRASIQRDENKHQQLIYIHTATNVYHKEVYELIRNIWEGKPYKIPEKRIRYEIETDLYDDYIGSYRTNFGLVHITREQDKLYLRPDPIPGKEELIPSSATTFYFAKQNIEWEFFLNDKKEVIGFGIKGDRKNMGLKEK